MSLIRIQDWVGRPVEDEALKNQSKATLYSSLPVATLKMLAELLLG